MFENKTITIDPLALVGITLITTGVVIIELSSTVSYDSYQIAFLAVTVNFLLFIGPELSNRLRTRFPTHTPEGDTDE